MPSKEVYDLRLRRAWPPVEVVERVEPRSEVSIYALIFGFGAVVTAIGGSAPGLTLVIGALAVYLGIYVLAFPRLFGRGDA